MAEGIRGVHQQSRKHILPPVSNNNLDEPPYYIQPLDITQNVLTNENQPDKLVLINFGIGTDPTGLRRQIWEDLCENNQNSFTICYSKRPKVNISSLPTIYKRNRQYPLWLSPRGGGLDCHRTWEALYLDIIPIVWHSTLDSLYTNLPIIIIKDWSEVNEEFLRNKLHEIAMKKAQQPSVCFIYYLDVTLYSLDRHMLVYYVEFQFIRLNKPNSRSARPLYNSKLCRLQFQMNININDLYIEETLTFLSQPFGVCSHAQYFPEYVAKVLIYEIQQTPQHFNHIIHPDIITDFTCRYHTRITGVETKLHIKRYIFQ
ncbi:unnamed protein product [Adineta steineri]|uniref:Uncharacterized protein n=1 Tax=Adineta steineri TaxID=433720 RepID=A0A816E400_9BILA|nr:unnamed protein product [Adineta steineri]CAF1642725.1 unnamed protein product [Adineta steineri]